VRGRFGGSFFVPNIELRNDGLLDRPCDRLKRLVFAAVLLQGINTPLVLYQRIFVSRFSLSSVDGPRLCDDFVVGHFGIDSLGIILHLLWSDTLACVRFAVDF